MRRKRYETREQIYQYLVDYKHNHNGVSPTLKEIADACFVSESTAKYHLLVLENDGRILILGRRAIEIPGSSWAQPDEEEE